MLKNDSGNTVVDVELVVGGGVVVGSGVVDVDTTQPSL